MLVLDQDKSYSFSNMTVKITDNTVLRDDTTTTTQETPDFNVLIPIHVPVGTTNSLELYYPGEINRYLNAHGTPNCLKNGFGADAIYAALTSGAEVGVYTINLRGASATFANAVVVMKYKVEKDVPYTDTTGAPYYYDKNGQLTTSPTDNTPVVRDVLHAKFELQYVANCKNLVDLYKKMNSLVSTTPDESGYQSMPIFAVMYRGASTFGNNVYMNLVPKTAEYDGNTYYTATVFDGINSIESSRYMSMDVNSGKKYNDSYFIETQFNAEYPTLRMMTAESIQDLYDLVNPYLYTLDEFIAGTQANPAKSFAAVDIFGANEFAFVTDEDSLDMQAANAVILQGGSDGTKTPDELFKDFFGGKILEDISSVLRYRVTYIPDLGYDEDTKKEIVKLVKLRNRMTTARLMVGNETFESAIVDHQSNYYENMPNVSMIAKCQSPMMFNEFTRRTVTVPAGYFDLVAVLNHMYKWGNPFQPFAGALCRWTGFIEDTMNYPANDAQFLQSLYMSRINVVMKDSEAGAYLADQEMNTVLTSDQTELNNAFLISSMLYDLVALVHRQHFKFNEAEEVRIFNENVNDIINQKYAPYSASLDVEVYRSGTIGFAKSRNIIKVTVDLKDISKYTDVEIVLTDE
nr:MAG TPA: hypothetical protein [Caudoviricetes sp.]